MDANGRFQMFQFSRNILIAVALFALSATGYTAELREGAPQKYVVKQGDTLWDISGKYLESPWKWPGLWRANPGVKNPDLIYPGDVLEIGYAGGKPYLYRSRRGSGSPIGTIDPKKIRPFLSRPIVLNDEMMETSGYILAFKDTNLMTHENSIAYARNIDATPGSRYDIIRKGNRLRDYETGEELGYGGTHVGTVTVLDDGDPARVKIGKIHMEVRQGDLLFPVKKTTVYRARPQAPENDISGHVIVTERNSTATASWDIVVIDRGKREGLVPGDVLVAKSKQRQVEDPRAPRKPLTTAEIGEPNSRPVPHVEMVTLPEEHAAHLLVFRVEERVSAAIVMKSKREVMVGAPVYSPAKRARH